MANDFHRDLSTETRGGREIDTGRTQSPYAGLGTADERSERVFLFPSNGRDYRSERITREQGAHERK